MKKNIVFIALLLQINMKSMMSSKGAFILETVLFMIQNFIFFLIWWAFFQKIPEIRGWQFRDLILMTVIVTTSFGLSRAFCGGCLKNLPFLISSGALDTMINKPKDPLIYILFSKSYIKGFSHILTGVVLAVFADVIKDMRLLLLIFAIISSAIVFVSSSIIVYSLVFFYAEIRDVAKAYLQSLRACTLYPANIYKGLASMMVFTVFPAGVIGYLPVELIKEFSYTKLISLCVIDITFMILATCIFRLGLRQYTSGNQISLHL